jgi:hypothetical protein
MKSTFDIEVRVPRAKLAELFADATNNPKWMDDVERIEALSGQLGMTGSRYRMVPKSGKRDFVVTVVARDLPNEVRLRLDGSGVVVSITDRFADVSQRVTRLVSEEVFTFKGPISKVIGVLAQKRIKNAHRRHMESFKRFAEALDN